MNSDFELMYQIYTEDFVELLRSEQFYKDFLNMAQSGVSSVSFMSRVVDKQIDIAWVEAIEGCIIALDTIIRNPRRFIAQEEEIVNIEFARKITPESIRHLAQHTSMIARVDGDEVTPSKILNIYKEESFETYENRFVHTLLINLQYFIDKRLKEMQDSVTGENITSLKLVDEFKAGKERVNYSLELTTSSPAFKMEHKVGIADDPKYLNKFERVERIRSILFEFQCSPLMKSLQGTALVRPPIMRTNVLQKDGNFKKVMELWDFIETYREAGYHIEVRECNELPGTLYLEDIFSSMVLQYAMMRHHAPVDGDMSAKARIRNVTPKMMARQFEEVLDDITINIDEVKTIFLDEVKKASKKRIANERKFEAIIDQAIAYEKNCAALQEEMEKQQRAQARQAVLEQRRAEKQAKEEELARVRKERLKQKQEKEKAQALEKAQKAKEKEKVRLQREKDKAQALKAAQRAKEKEKSRQQHEKEKAQALEVSRKAKEKEKASQQREKEKARALEAAQRAKEKEKARRQRDKEKAQALEAAQKAKEKEKVRLQREKEKALELEKNRKAKEKEKARLQREIDRVEAIELKLKDREKIKNDK